MRSTFLIFALIAAHSAATASSRLAAEPSTSIPSREVVQANPLPSNDASVARTTRRKEVSCDCKGRVDKRKDASGNVEEFIYHPRTGKLILILNGDSRSVFHYNEDGKLIRAQDRDSRVINVSYNRRGLVRTIREVDGKAGNKRLLNFKYGATDKPVEIHLVGVGRIAVSYDSEGEISGVRSTGGTKMAIEVTKAFQALRSAIPGGGLK